MGPRLPHMLKDAALTAFVALALGFFIVGFRTYDASGKGLVFDYQFGDLAIAIATIFVGRMGLLLAADGLRWPALVLGAVLGGMLQEQFVSIFAGLLAKIGQDCDVAADDGLQRSAQISNHAARPDDDSAHDAEILDDAIAGKFVG